MNINLLNVTKFTASLLLLLICGNAYSQAPQKMSYQAVIRNNSNVLVTSSPIGMKISILQGSSSGTAVYVETQTAKTNVNGLVSIEIGSGTVVTGTFAGINWGAGPYFVKTETDPRGGTAYSIAGTSQLMSVPYALFSANGGSGSQGPQGPIGLTGPAGATGPQGPPGRDGSMLVDADATTKGKIQLAGDLGGSASAPTVPALANKVDKEDGKGLSTEDYTTTEKTKLEAITGTNTGDQDLSGLATTDAVDLKVDKVDGKGLSTEDYTTTEKTKLAAITGTNTGDQDLSGLATIASPSFEGTVITPASTTAGAGLRIPHGVAPTTAVNGDIWTTSSGLFANIDDDVKQYPTLSDGNNFTGNNTFSGTTLIFGNSTAFSTTSIGTGATEENATKTVNIATNGASGSNTNVSIGPILGGGTTTLGQSTAASTVNIGTGATLENLNKAVNIATNGTANSTTTVNIGPIAGGSATTLSPSTGNSTVNIGTGATAESLNKTVNIATNGTLNSTSTVNIGPRDGFSTTTFGQSTANSTVNIGNGATVSGSIKAVNIGTGGLGGSTTNTTIGTTSGGGNNVTINGPTNFLGPASFTGNQFTISATNPIIGNSTAASTIDIGTGATLASTIKNINIGTNGALNSTTNVNIGPALGLGTITLGQSTAASTVNIGTGAIASGIKAINIGTGGVAGSTTNTIIGTTSGGVNNVTINGPTTFNNMATFTGTNITIGNSTAAGIYSLANGALNSGIKEVNIGTGGLSGSNTNVTIGASTGGGTTTIGPSTAASTVNIGTGATLTSTTKAINIGTNGISGSTTNVTIGSATGASTTRINGSVQHTLTSTASALTLTASHRYVVVTAGVLITLPTASTVAGTVYTINARIAGVTISSFNNLSGTATTTIAIGTSITIISDGTAWQQVN